MSALPPSPSERASQQADQDLLARAHPRSLIADPGGRVRWMSEPLQELLGPCRLGEPLEGLLRGRGSAKPACLDGEKLATRERLELLRRGRPPIAVDAATVHLRDGHPEGSRLVVLRPSCERQDARADTSQAVETLGVALDTSPTAALAFDSSGFLVYANPALAALLGRGSGDVAGKALGLLAQAGREPARVLAALLGKGGGEDVELLCSDGSSRWVSASPAELPLRSGGGAIRLVLLHDVTERRRAAAEIERRSCELRHLVDSVSHDLRSPLVSLLGFTKVLREQYEQCLDATGRSYIERVEQAARTMRALVEDVLDLARLSRSGPRKQPVNPREVLDRLCAEVKPRLDERGIDLALPAEPPLVSCDATQLYQVFSNLIGNAIEHMGSCPEPRIRVEVVEEPDAHHLRVADNGRGIDPADQERIFRTFESARPPADSRRSSGIGLAIVKKIAEGHGGRTWVESRPGRGATFHLTLPRDEQTR